MQHLCSNANGIIYNIALYITLFVNRKNHEKFTISFSPCISRKPKEFLIIGCSDIYTNPSLSLAFSVATRLSIIARRRKFIRRFVR